MQYVQSTSKSKKNENQKNRTLIVKTSQTALAPRIDISKVLPSISAVGVVAAEQATFSTTVLDNEDAIYGNFVAPGLSNVSTATLPKQPFAPVESVRSFGISVDIGLVRKSNHQTAEVVCLILKGAGLRQDSESLWTGVGCGIEEATDSLSDVFLELQSLGAILNESLRHVRVTMHEEL